MTSTEQDPDRAETARYIKATWEGLLAPDCADADLIDLGKAVFAKVRLSALDDAVLGRLLPHLSTMATTIGDLVLHRDPSSRFDREDTAYLIRSTWDSLLAPSWLRNDVVDLGKQVRAKTPLSKLDARLFERLLPHLTSIAKTLQTLIEGHTFKTAASPTSESVGPQPAAEPATSSSPSAGQPTVGDKP